LVVFLSFSLFFDLVSNAWVSKSVVVKSQVPSYIQVTTNIRISSCQQPLRRRIYNIRTISLPRNRKALRIVANELAAGVSELLDQENS
jgi:hypothetical protein